MNRSCLRLVAALLIVMAVAACSQLGIGGGKRQGDERDANERAKLAVRLSANDQIRLHLTDLRIALALKPEQASAWQAYDDKVIEMLSDSAKDAERSASGSALNRIERRAAAMQQLANAAKKLYSILTDEQKRIADRLLPATIP